MYGIWIERRHFNTMNIYIISMFTFFLFIKYDLIHINYRINQVLIIKTIKISLKYDQVPILNYYKL